MTIAAFDVINAIGSTIDELNEIGPDDLFENLNIDSLALVEAAVILSNKFNVPVDEFELADAGTARVAAELLSSRILQPTS